MTYYLVYRPNDDWEVVLLSPDTAASLCNYMNSQYRKLEFVVALEVPND